MRLISIGSSAQAQIVLNSQYVSGYHAELLQLDNGDMMLVDKGSSNGTFVNGNRIAPEKEVTVTRNDTITIADQTLPWSMIPVLQIPDKENIRIIKGIGSHYLNAIHVSGNQVSRFHATVKQTKDGNGISATTVPTVLPSMACVFRKTSMSVSKRAMPLPVPESLS